MKKITFLLFFFSILFQANSQVTIGSGNLESENAPFEAYYGYSYAQTVYLASEINTSGTITDIQWYYSGTSALPNSQELVIYMAESPRIEFASDTDWEPIASFTQVYSGGITLTAGTAGWVQITLDTPFIYNGTGNLIVAVEENMPGYDSSGDDFYNSQVTTNRTISHFSDSVNADPAAPPTASNIDDTIPNIILGGIVQACPNPTDLSGVISETTIELTWNGTSESNWEFLNQLAGEPVPTDTDSGTPIATNFVEIMNLTEGADYEFYVRADCLADGFSSWTGPFSYRISGPGETCSNPIQVTLPLPYITDDDTSNYGDDYSGSPGASCGSTSGYLNGDDVVYQYTPASDTSIDIELSNLSGNYAGVFVYDSCDNIGVSCLTGATNGFSSTDLLIDNFSVTGGQSYYIVISTWAAPQSIAYTLTITENTCIDAVAAYTVRQDCLNGPQFFVDVDLTDLGSATSITVSDNQGSTPQTTAAIGLFSFGPFANGTGVVITVTNDDDANCILTSGSLTQDQCVLNLVDCEVGPLNFNYCYGNNDDTSWLFQSTDGSPVRLIFNAGGIESCCDDILIYDGVDNTGTLLYVGNNGGNLAGLQFDSIGNSLFMEIDADGSVSCQSGSGCCTTEWDFTVSCATCVNPIVDYSVRQDCINGPQFFVDVDLTDLGSATSITVSDNQGSTPQTTAVIGLFSFGPFANGTGVVITTSNDDDPNCTLTSTSLTQDQCVLNIVDCEVGPLNFNYCYGNNDDTTWLFQSSDGSPVRLTFNAGGIENCCDDILIYDGVDNTGTLLYVGNNGGNLAGLQFDSIGNSLFMEIDADGSVSCQAGSFCCSTEWDFTVTCATCVNPTATYTVIDDCDNGEQFLIDVNITSLGDATSLTISNNMNATTVPVTAVGTYQVGPFPFLQNVIITTNNDQDVNCVINSAPIQLLACPPVNDNCSGAIVAAVNADESCNVTTPGTLIEATPSGIPSGTCTGNPDDDVWFEFEALGEQQIITIQNITGGTTNIDHAVYSGACGSLTQLYCSDDVVSVTPALTVGETYFIRVFSGGSLSETSSFNLCINTLGPPTYCTEALPICAGDLVYPSVVGDDVAPPYIDYDCLGSVPDPTWNSIYFDTPGDYTFTLAQTGLDGFGNDIDFIIWGPFNNQEDGCYELLPSSVADCSFSAVSIETITLNNVQAGDVFVILITNYSQEAGTYTFTQASGPDNGTNCEIVCDVEISYDGTILLEDTDNVGFTEPIDLCGIESIELVADSPYADNYQWYNDGFEIVGATSPSYTVTESGIYQAFVDGDVCEGFSLSLQVPVRLFSEPIATPVDDMITCDDISADGTEPFDLESQTILVLGALNPADFAVTYHISMTEAESGTGALTSPYNNTSNPQTIYVRVVDVDALGLTTSCFATTSFDLIISGLTPTATSVDMELCDDTTLDDGFESFTLTDNNVNVLNGQDDTQFTVSYHATEAEAISGDNPLVSPYTNVSNPQTIWARVESNVSSNCYSVVDFNLIVNPLPEASASPDVTGCDFDDDGISDYDLTVNEDVILGGQTDMTVTYYTTQVEADAGTPEIANPGAYSTILTTIYVRVENNATGCYNTTSFGLADGEAPVTTFTTDFEYEVCPDATVPVIITATPVNYTEAEVTITWYRDGGVIAGETGLTLPVLNSGLYEIEVRFNETGCIGVTEQTVIELESCIIPQGISPNNDLKNDRFDLSSFDVSKIEIFNRNGTMVYSKHNYSDEWFGQTNDGDELPVGTYFYSMIYQGGKEKTGWVYINR